MENQATIIKRLRALLAKTTENGCTEEEAQAAAVLAQKLMQRYNLELAEVQAASGEKGPEYTQQWQEIGQRNWRRLLLHVVAVNTFCKVVIFGKRASVIGQRHNIEAVTLTFEFLHNELVRLADAGYREYALRERETWGYVEQKPGPWKEDFYRGAIQQVNVRLEAQREAFKAEGAASMALIVVNERELAEATKQFHGRTTKARAGRKVRSDGYHAGQMAGASMNLTPTKQIGG